MDHSAIAVDSYRRARSHDDDPQILQDYTRFQAGGEGLISQTALELDGRLSISLNILRNLPDLPKDYAKDVYETAADEENYHNPPRMNIVVMLVGTRGDVYPFLALARRLKADGHRIRVATHGKFRNLVLESDLEFFNIGGSPKDLLSYILKDPGLIPGLTSLTNDNTALKRAMLKFILDGCWKACFEADPISRKHFAADAIISNSQAFANIHCAEALGIPLNVCSTIPWSPTFVFPHPLVDIKSSNAKRGLTHYLTYALTDQMTWLGLGDIINKFRENTLGLSSLTIANGPSAIDRLKIPWTYFISPALVSKPSDWKNNIDIVGSYTTPLSTFTPSIKLESFLSTGIPTFYIGFGSIVVDNPRNLNQIIFQAVSKTGVRALVSTSYGEPVPDNILVVEGVPQDWIFNNVYAVIHQGDAETTTLGLKMGKPTATIPFFADQLFWGDRVYRSGAGPRPIKFENLDVHKLIDAINLLLSPPTLDSARRMSHHMSGEDAVWNGVQSFYRHLPLKNMRCDLDPSRLAVWWSTEHCLKLSAYAAQILADELYIDMNKLDLHRPIEYDLYNKETDPVSGGASSVFWTITNNYPSVTQIFYKSMMESITLPMAIPRGVIDMFISINEGIQGIPRTRVPEREQVTGLRSGLLAGGRSLIGGTLGAVVGLFTEPLQGAQEEGVRGAIRGSVRGLKNVAVKPFGGAYGFVSHPLRGLVVSIAKRLSKKTINWRVQRTARISDGFLEVKLSNESPGGELARLRILDAFRIAMQPENEKRRKGEIGKAVQEALDETVAQDSAVINNNVQFESLHVPAMTGKETLSTGSMDYPQTPSSSTFTSEWTPPAEEKDVPMYKAPDMSRHSSQVDESIYIEDVSPPSYTEVGPSTHRDSKH